MVFKLYADEDVDGVFELGLFEAGARCGGGLLVQVLGFLNVSILFDSLINRQAPQKGVILGHTGWLLDVDRCFRKKVEVF